MKKAKKLLGITAFVAVIGLGMAACDNGTTNNGTNEPSAHTHDWGEWSVTSPADCETAGVETRVCSIDATHKETKPIAALGHDWGEWAGENAPSCTEGGSGTRTCKRHAEHTETDNGIPALGHEWGEWEITEEPTCTEKGEKERECERCGETDTQEIAIDPTAHEWEWVETIPATYTEAGEETGRCKHDSAHTNGTRPIPQIPFTSAGELHNWLNAHPANTAAAPYAIRVNVNDLGKAADSGSVGYVLKANNTKYVSLDLSGSTITAIPEYAFYHGGIGCVTLTGITIPDSVTRIE
jgi:hypothetical protein